MKKLVSSLMVSMLLLTACSSPAQKETPEVKNDAAKTQEVVKDIVMVTDVGTIDDKSFNQGTYEGLKAFDSERSTYIKPQGKSTVDYEKAIELGISQGAKVIVTPGFLFSEAIYNSQEKYPDVKFILIDAVPSKMLKDEKGEKKEDVKVAANTVSILFKEQEAGFFAGYAAVKEGYKNLGFMGGIAVPAVIKFGQGFLYGAAFAAKELGINDVTVKFNYLNGFDAKPEFKAKALSWYQSGTEIIFAAAGGAGNSVMAAAADTQKVMVGVDVDQSSESPTVITSAIKLLGKSVTEALNQWKEDKFPGGQTLELGLADGMIGLPMETSRFKKFTAEDYKALYEKLLADKTEVPYDINKATSLEVEGITVEYIK